MFEWKILSNYVSYLEYGKGDRPALAYIHGKKRAVVVDGGCSANHANQFLKHLSEKEREKIACVLLTHGHWDHYFGAGTISSNVICNPNIKYATASYQGRCIDKKSIEQLFQEGKLIDFVYRNMLIEFEDSSVKAEIPYLKVISGSTNIDLGGVNVIYEPIQTCHCNHSSIIYVVQDKIFFAGDCLWPNMESNTEEWYYSLSSFIKLKKELKKYGPEIIVDSHDAPRIASHIYKWMDKIEYIIRAGLEKKLDKKQILESMPQGLKDISSCYDELIYDSCINAKK